MRAWLAALALLAVPVGAQDADAGCTEAAPCPWTFDVDAGGIMASDSFAFTERDWLFLDVLNFDTVDHTLHLDERTWHVEADFGEAERTPFQLKAGTYTLVDQPSGDVHTVQVASATDAETEGAPGLGMIVAVGLLWAAWRRR